MFLPQWVPNKQIPDQQNTGFQNNPYRTVPFPQPSNMPQGCWYSGSVRLPWGAAPAPIGSADTPATYFRGCLWTSPIYDLRPNLRGLSASGTTQVGAGSSSNAIPIWGWSSHMLYVQIRNLRAGAAEGVAPVLPPGFSLPGNSLKILASEFAHVSDPGQLTQVLPSTDITSQVNTDTDSAILNFRPLGEGLPVRFWRLNLQFIVVNQAAAGGEPLPLNLEAGYY